MAKKSSAKPVPSKRAYLKQSDVPMFSLSDAMRVPQVIFDNYAGKAASPFQVAKALNVDPKGTQLRLLTGAAIAFGLTEGGAQSASISVTDLSRRILRPKSEDEDLRAKREAVLRPRIFGDFLRTYDKSPMPRHDIALNVIEEMGVARDKADDVLKRIESSAKSVGFLTEINGKLYVALENATAPTLDEETADGLPEPEENSEVDHSAALPDNRAVSHEQSSADDERKRRVFITHGKNRDLVEPIKKLLEFGEMIPVISVEKQSVSKPVPEKVMDDMRACGAAIIHVDVDTTIKAEDGSEHVLLNPNVLIEIGAAMAFYGRRFVLLVREGVKLPSNLQGLYEVRYGGTSIDASATIKLLEAIKDIKNHDLPS